MFAKKDNKDKGVVASTHLVCNAPEGPKYKAALNWGIPVIHKVRIVVRNYYIHISGNWILSARILSGIAPTFLFNPKDFYINNVFFINCS